jgi:hypothetical protein
MLHFTPIGLFIVLCGVAVFVLILVLTAVFIKGYRVRIERK